MALQAGGVKKSACCGSMTRKRAEWLELVVRLGRGWGGLKASLVEGGLAGTREMGERRQAVAHFGQYRER